jgi:PAS domain-containing protein
MGGVSPELAGLIHALLDAAGDPRTFRAALATSLAPLDAVGIHGFLIRENDGNPVLTVSVAREIRREDLFADYERRWRSTDPRFSIAMRRPNEVHSDVAVIDPATFERSGLYNENLRVNGIRYTLFGSFSVSDEQRLAVAYLRLKEAGAFQQRDIDRLTSLMPSLGRCFRLHELVCSLATENRDLREALDRMPHAVALVGADHRVKAANAAARVLLSAGDGLRFLISSSMSFM